mmetsp:Transcript_105570/g.298354  ORF Transcript_105570/g.298354 Transcript_105570/m.298354 type:complete len:257 (-) Transcript_105570:546-1316(-)
MPAAKNAREMQPLAVTVAVVTEAVVVGAGVGIGRIARTPAPLALRHPCAAHPAALHVDEKLNLRYNAGDVVDVAPATLVSQPALPSLLDDGLGSLVGAGMLHCNFCSTVVGYVVPASVTRQNYKLVAGPHFVLHNLGLRRHAGAPERRVPDRPRHREASGDVLALPNAIRAHVPNSRDKGRSHLAAALADAPALAGEARRVVAGQRLAPHAPAVRANEHGPRVAHVRGVEVPAPSQAHGDGGPRLLSVDAPSPIEL